MTTGFQRQVNLQPAPAVEGDFASINPRVAVLAGPGGLVAGAAGVNVGKFAWLDADGVTVHSYGSGYPKPAGFLARTGQALIQNYLEGASMNVPEGFPVTLFNEGDFWAKVTGSTAATIDATVYATYADGAITIGSAAAGASFTGSVGATMTASIGSTFTATGTGTSLAVTSLTGYLAVGDTISGTGVPANTTIIEQVSGTTGAAGTYTTSAATTASAATVTSFGDTLNVTARTGYISVGDTVSNPADATITAQLTGTAGSTGTYTLSERATAYTASGTITAFGAVMSVSAVASGVLQVGDLVSGTMYISSQISGATGSTGLYGLSEPLAAYLASGSLTASGGVLTSFVCKSAAAVGELVKISTWGA